MSIGEMLAVIGLPTAVTAFCFWMIEQRIIKREKAAQEKAAEREKARMEYLNKRGISEKFRW